MLKKYPIHITGFLVPFVYLVFTILAYLSYPLQFSPLSNWLSDLGNLDLNINGAKLYNTGIIASSVLLMIFFIGLSIWKMEGQRVQLVMLRLTQVFGGLGAVCMILSAIFPINHYTVHAFWSTCLYVMLSTAFVFSAAALRYHKWVPRLIILPGITSAALVISTAFFQTIHLLEWITLLVFLTYIALLGVETRKQYSSCKGDLLNR